MADITVDQTACIRCGACVDVCNVAKVFELEEQSSVAIRPEQCWACGQCIAVCPTDAIDHEAFPLESCPIFQPEDLPPLETLTTAFRARRSFRTFEDKPVPRETVRELINLSRWAPTARNSQSFDWIAFDDRSRIDGLSRATTAQLAHFIRLARNPLTHLFLSLSLGREAMKRLKEAQGLAESLTKRQALGEDPIFHHAPAILIGHNPANNPFGRDDAIYAAYNLMLAAAHFGLGTCQIGLFQIIAEKSARLRRKIGLPEGRAPQVTIALGYPRHSFRRLLPRRSPNLSWNPR